METTNFNWDILAPKFYLSLKYLVQLGGVKYHTPMEYFAPHLKKIKIF